MAFDLSTLSQEFVRQQSEIITLKEGYLEKQGARVKNWKNRWFKLTSDGRFLYFDGKGGRLLNEIPMRQVSRVRVHVMSEQTMQQKHALALEEPNRTWLLVATSKELRDEWMFLLDEHKGAQVGDGQFAGVAIPILGLVNVMSGGRKGYVVKEILESCKVPVFDLLEMTKEESKYDEYCNTLLKFLKQVKQMDDDPEIPTHKLPRVQPRVLICGGDGTVGWALSFVDRALLDARILPFYEKMEEYQTHYELIVRSEDTMFQSEEEIVSDDDFKDFDEDEQLVMEDEAELVEAKDDDDATDEAVPSTLQALQEMRFQKIKSLALLAKTTVARTPEQTLYILRAINRTRYAPTMTTLPLGTGNDFSRCLGRGNQYPGSPAVPVVLDSLQNPLRHVTLVDRWGVKFFNKAMEVQERQCAEMLCYFSIGYTAQITVEFQEARHRNPEKFNKPWKNKLQYVKVGGKVGVQEASGRSKPFNNVITVTVDGRKMKLPKLCRSLVISNLASMADGLYFWGSATTGHKKDIKDYTEPSLGDGKLEVMASKGVYKFVQMKMGMSHYRRLAQGSHVVVDFSEQMPIQIDGEAWREGPGRIEITFKTAVMALVGEDEPRGGDTSGRGLKQLSVKPEPSLGPEGEEEEEEEEPVPQQ